MYNTDLPLRVDLPTSAQLWRSTIIAAVSAAVILVTVVLPSEYGIDPTGVGRRLGLTEMGEIKVKLAAEAAADAAATKLAPATAPKDESVARRLNQIETMLLEQKQELTSRFAGQRQGNALEQQPDRPVAPQQTAPAPESAVRPEAPPQAWAAPPAPSQQRVAVSPPAAREPNTAAPQRATRGRSDEVSFKLAPGEGTEIKLVMRQGAKANFEWLSSGGPVNFDTHGDGSGQKISYQKGRGVSSDNGVLEAAFDGNHGWFWRNRGTTDVSMTLRTNGAYTDIKRMQ